MQTSIQGTGNDGRPRWVNLSVDGARVSVYVGPKGHRRNTRKILLRGPEAVALAMSLQAAASLAQETDQGADNG